MATLPTPAPAPIPSPTYEDEPFEQVENETDSGYEMKYDTVEEEEFVEEEVESVPFDPATAMNGLAVIGHSALMHSNTPNTSASSVSSSTKNGITTASTDKPKSSLPSLLGGLPSITAVSSSLTSAGRAHFTQTSLFGTVKLSTPSTGASSYATQAPGGATVPNETASPESLAAYARSNQIWSSESLGIFPIAVRDDQLNQNTATPNDIKVDQGRLRLWAGSIGSDAIALPNSFSTSTSSTAASTFNNSLFLRAALCPNESSSLDASSFNDSNYLHIFIEKDATSPLTTSSTNQLVNSDGEVDAALPTSFHTKRLGLYRIQVLGQSSSMPETPDSYENFIAKAQQIDSELTPNNSKSAFDIQPITTLFVGVEKLTQIDPAPTTSSPQPHILPPLPLNSTHTFWLSTHQPNRSCSLVFGDSSDDQFELSLDVTPLNQSILNELNVPDIELDVENEVDHDQLSRKEKKLAKSKAKKKQKKARAVPPPEHISNGDSTTAPPSLSDLLATLSVSSTASLPSSILATNQSMAQLTELTSSITNSKSAAAAASSTALTNTPPTMAATSNHLLSSSSMSLMLQTLDRRTSWPYRVELSAMRLGEESEGHVTFENLDLLHNQPMPNSASTSSSIPSPILVGDHEVRLLRTVGLLANWCHPNDTSQLNQPVLVSQQPFLSYHIQLQIKRLGVDEAREREMDALMG